LPRTVRTQQSNDTTRFSQPSAIHWSINTDLYTPVVRKHEAERKAERKAASQPTKTAKRDGGLRPAKKAIPLALTAANLALVATASRNVSGWLAGREPPEEDAEAALATGRVESGSKKDNVAPAKRRAYPRRRSHHRCRPSPPPLPSYLPLDDLYWRR
jgi:hypothetical protein